MTTNAVHAIVLAAGKGTRMKSDQAKVLHELFFAPMIHHVLSALEGLDLDRTVLVTGHQAGTVEQALSGRGLRFARQTEQLGTGHAVLAAAPDLAEATGFALILCGDTPLVRRETLSAMIDFHRAHGQALTVMTTTVEDPTHYGRVLANPDGTLSRIVEEKDASPEERMVREINAGIYCVDLTFLFPALRQVGTDNRQGEVYLTDIVAIANRAGRAVRRFICPDPVETLGVNSRVELAQAHRVLQERRNRSLMLAGVSILDPASVCIGMAVQVGRDVRIHSHAVVTGASVLGDGCELEPFVHLSDCRVPAGARVASFSRVGPEPSSRKHSHHTPPPQGMAPCPT